MMANKELFMKWIKNLFYVQCATLVAGIITNFPLLDDVMSWVNKILGVAMIYIFFKLAPIKDRYRKAAIFSSITLGIILISIFTDIKVLVFVGSIISLIALYQEYSAHSEMMDGIDDKLARKWHSLFNWQLIGGVLLGVLEVILLMILVVAMTWESDAISALLLAVSDVFDIIIRIVYLIYLKRMLSAYANYEPEMESEIPEGEI